MRLFHLPNELNAADPRIRQIGCRRVFAGLHEQGIVSALETFSFLHEAAASGEEAALQDILQRVSAFQPDLVFWQHVGTFRVTQSYFSELRRRAPNACLAYHDEDPYARLVKRITPAMDAMIRASDIVLISGLGRLASLYRAHGAQRVGYLPHYYDVERTSPEPPDDHRRDHQAVMIANSGRRRRLPMLYVPGGRRRAALASRLSSSLGQGFALYGRGWDGLKAARGPLPFDRQAATISSAWLSVNWDHYDDIPFYSSDRLPISLAAGVVHVTSHHVGYEQALGSCPGLYWARDVKEAVAMVEWLLSRPRRDLAEEGASAKVWAAANLEADVIFVRAIGFVAMPWLRAPSDERESRPAHDQECANHLRCERRRRLDPGRGAGCIGPPPDPA